MDLTKWALQFLIVQVTWIPRRKAFFPEENFLQAWNIHCFEYCSSWKRDPNSWEVKNFWFWSVTPRPVWLMEENNGEVRASLVAQLVKKLPVMQDTWVQSLGREDPLEEEWKPILVFLPGKSHGQRNLSRYSPWVTWVGHNLATKPSPCGGMNDLDNFLCHRVDVNFVYKLEAGWS